MGEVQSIIYKDDLTNLYNKRFFIEIEKFINDNNVFITIFDIDDFKYINDTYGHNSGDKVLKELSVLIENLVENNIFALRYGGDEFIIVFIKREKEQVLRHLQLLKQSIENHRVFVEHSVIDFTCSFGVSKGSVRNKIKILNEADKALYRAKQKGKNRIVFYEKDIVKDNYFPILYERKIKGEIIKGRNCIIKGGFQTGKKFLAKHLQRYAKGYSFYCFESFNERDIKEPFIMCYNPAYLDNNNVFARKYYNIIKEYNPVVFNIRNYNRNEIISICKRNNKIPTLLLVNYIDIVSSGNVGILNRIFNSSNCFHTKPFNIEFVKNIFSILSKDTIYMIERILPLGIRFNLKDIRKFNIDNEWINYLEQLMILQRQNNNYIYTYPPIFFYLRTLKNINKKTTYDYILKLINDIKDFNVFSNERKATIVENIIDYGDWYLGENYLNRIKYENDKIRKLRAYIYIENRDIDKAKVIVNKIKDKNTQKDLMILLQTKSQDDIDKNDIDSINRKLLYINQLITKYSIEQAEKILNDIDITKIKKLKEKIAYYAAMADIEYYKREYTKALELYRRAMILCRRAHYIGKYGKLLMKSSLVLDDMGEYKKALDYILKALSIIDLCMSEDSYLSAKLNLSVIYANMGNFEKSIEVLSQLLVNEFISYRKYFRAYILHNLSEIYLRQWNLNESNDFIQKALKLFENEKEKTPLYMLILHNKINLMLNKKLIHIDIKKDMDTIDKMDCLIVDFLVNNKNFEFEYIIKTIKDTIGNHNKLFCIETFCFAAFYYRDNVEIKRQLLKQALVLIDKKNQFIRYRKIKKLMEE